ncbi:hypothetical protein DAI22_05g218484 [Oryza sativa Japonica Group]|nr:hypothetical protein DAI22_05g218484 [Oryza sativa Japonica Group]
MLTQTWNGDNPILHIIAMLLHHPDHFHGSLATNILNLYDLLEKRLPAEFCYEKKRLTWSTS